MSPPEPFDLSLAAIAAMAAITFLIRAGGFGLMALVPPTRRVRRMLEALPGSIVAAVVLPIAAKNGAPAMFAVAAAVAAMIASRNALLGVAAGIAVAALIRNAAI